MEPTKQAALMICLQQSQVDVADAMREKDEQTKQAANAKAEVSKLRAVIGASGSDNMQRIVELQDTIRDLQNVIETHVETIDRQEDEIEAADNLLYTMRDQIAALDNLITTKDNDRMHLVSMTRPRRALC